LRCFVHACPSKWINWLSLAKYWYNTSLHSALGQSPFEVLYGYTPKHFGFSVDSAIPDSTDLSTWLSDTTLMQDFVRQHLLRAQMRMKRQSDKKRSECSFSVRDWVFLKLQPYVQSSLARRSNQKLAFHFFGPYHVEAKVGAVAYKLALPPTSAIHLVFYVSQLKRSHGDHPLTDALPSDSVQF